MKTSSCKAKGRRLQQWVGRQIAKATGYEFGKDKPIASREMGQNGMDIRLVGEVREDFPFAVECKNQENWAIHDWIEQAKQSQEPDMDWMLIAKRNNGKPVLFMDAETWFEYWVDYLRLCSITFENPAKEKNAIP
jgi:hypothetical protein